MSNFYKKNNNDIDQFIADITNVKDVAWLYIDDRCLNFNGEYPRFISTN